MFYEVGLWLAALVGCVSLWMRNWTAAPLLASFLVSTGLCWAGVPFNFWLWFTIDVIVISLIFRVEMTKTDMSIVGMFPIAWVAYAFLKDPWLGFITWAVVVVQFLLTLPAKATIARIRRIMAKGNGTAGPLKFEGAACRSPRS